MDSWVRKFPWRRDRLPTPVFLGFPGGSDGKGSTCSAGDLDSIPGLGRFPGGGHGNPLQYSCLENRHGQRSLVGYSPWGCKESDTTERRTLSRSLSAGRATWSRALFISPLCLSMQLTSLSSCCVPRYHTGPNNIAVISYLWAHILARKTAIKGIIQQFVIKRHE